MNKVNLYRSSRRTVAKDGNAQICFRCFFTTEFTDRDQYGVAYRESRARIYTRQICKNARYPSISMTASRDFHTLQAGIISSILFNMIPLLLCLFLSLQLYTAFSLPRIPPNNPPVSLIQIPTASNVSKPLSVHLTDNIEPLSDFPPNSSDTFAIPNTNLIIKFSEFGPTLDIAELNRLLTQAQDDIQIQIDDHGTDALAPYNMYRTWGDQDIALDVYRMTRHRITLRQFRSMVEGLGLYMIMGRRSREVKFRLLEVDSSSISVGGDIWLI